MDKWQGRSCCLNMVNSKNISYRPSKFSTLQKTKHPLHAPFLFWQVINFCQKQNATRYALQIYIHKWLQIEIIVPNDMPYFCLPLYLVEISLQCKINCWFFGNLTSKSRLTHFSCNLEWEQKFGQGFLLFDFARCVWKPL
jgi:hypothetical protein